MQCIDGLLALDTQGAGTSMAHGPQPFLHGSRAPLPGLPAQPLLPSSRRAELHPRHAPARPAALPAAAPATRILPFEDHYMKSMLCCCRVLQQKPNYNCVRLGCLRHRPSPQDPYTSPLHAANETRTPMQTGTPRAGHTVVARSCVRARHARRRVATAQRRLAARPPPPRAPGRTGQRGSRARGGGALCVRRSVGRCHHPRACRTHPCAPQLPGQEPPPPSQHLIGAHTHPWPSSTTEGVN